MEALKNSRLRGNNAARGLWFECCVYDALIKFGISKTDIITHIDNSHGKDAEADIMVNVRANGSVVIFCKTSLRERWKQEERDAIVMRNVMNPPPRCIGVMLKERARDTAKQTINNLTKQRAKYVALEDIITVYDESAINKLFSSLI